MKRTGDEGGALITLPDDAEEIELMKESSEPKLLSKSKTMVDGVFQRVESS